jgi:anti-sigma B factor antagonist
MEITTTADGALATLAVVGTIDTRASADFESALLKAVEGGSRQVIIDFSRLDLITSSGIRVLVLFAKRLSAIGGGVVLCCLSPDVQRVFDIAGLTGQFRIMPTRADAAAALTAGAAPPRRNRGSRVARLVGSLLGDRGEPREAERPADAAGQSPLSKQVAQLLGESPKPPRT